MGTALLVTTIILLMALRKVRSSLEHCFRNFDGSENVFTRILEELFDKM
jgi:hypothetical protein